MTYNGKLHETAVRFPNTDIWLDTCAEEDLNYSLERGTVGATTNPLIVGAVIKKELKTWESRIKEVISENKSFNEEEVAWTVIEEMARQRAELLLPVYQEYKGLKGRLSIQTNAKFYRNWETMLEQALRLNKLGKNMQVKMPTCEAGIKAFEEATYHGISINATVSFTVAQAVAVAEAVERGLRRRESEGLSTEGMAPVCTIMIGRTDDWIKEVVKNDNLVMDPECMEWAGVAVMKHAYEIYKERGYRTRLLSAAYRNHYHWSQLVGGDLAMTIPADWQKRINESSIPVENNIDVPIKEEYMNQLRTIPDFIKAYEEDGMTVAEFERFGAFRRTLTGFLAGYDDLIKLIRGYMITDPFKDR
jgi:transaldolase